MNDFTKTLARYNRTARNTLATVQSIISLEAAAEALLTQAEPETIQYYAEEILRTKDQLKNELKALETITTHLEILARTDRPGHIKLSPDLANLAAILKNFI